MDSARSGSGLETIGVKSEYYYYFRTDLKTNKSPIVTVCLLENDSGERARGIAICSDLDHPIKSKGRTIAKGRAIKALIHKSNCEDVRTMRASDILFRVEADQQFRTLMPHKAEFQPSLTDLERRFVR